MFVRNLIAAVSLLALTSTAGAVDARLSPEELETLPQCHALTNVHARSLNALATMLEGYRDQIPTETRTTTDELAANARAAALHAGAKAQAFSLVAMRSFKSYANYKSSVDTYEQIALQNVLVYGFARFNPAATRELSFKTEFCGMLLERHMKAVTPGLELPDASFYR